MWLESDADKLWQSLAVENKNSRYVCNLVSIEMGKRAWNFEDSSSLCREVIVTCLISTWVKIIYNL